MAPAPATAQSNQHSNPNSESAGGEKRRDDENVCVTHENETNGVTSEVPTDQFSSFRSFQPGMAEAKKSSDPVSSASERLLMSPTFFTDCLGTLGRMGLVGEQKNALALYLVGTSRLLPLPMNVLAKGHSSTGKNYLVSRVLGLFPEDSYVEITSASETSWNYSADSFTNKIVYVQEQNQASGSVHPVRLLISEGKLVRLVAVRKKGSEHNTMERFEAKGPIAALSTTTQDRLEIDDETRHISIWMDDSPEQTKRILRGYTRQSEPLSEAELAAWRAVQDLAATRTGIEIVLPTWFDEIADAMVEAGHDVRLRRYFPAFCQACRTVTLLRSFQHKQRVDRLQVEFADFAIAHTLLDSVISESLHHEGGQTLETAQCIRTLAARTGESVLIQQVAEALNLPYKRAAERIQKAERAGLIQLANSPEVRNVKRFVATSPQQLLPEPRALYQKLRFNTPCSFNDPLTGELILYLPETAETGKVTIPVSAHHALPTMVQVPLEPGKPTQAVPEPATEPKAGQHGTKAKVSFEITSSKERETEPIRPTAQKARRHSGINKREAQRAEVTPDPAPCSTSKLVYETFHGGPKVLAVEVPGRCQHDLPIVKFYVCVGEQKSSFSTLDAAIAECARIAEKGADADAAPTKVVAAPTPDVLSDKAPADLAAESQATSGVSNSVKASACSPVQDAVVEDSKSTAKQGYSRDAVAVPAMKQNKIEPQSPDHPTTKSEAPKRPFF
jgi:hypothetical protein